jgi:hypothetical protein
MKNSKAFSMWIYFFLILALSACGGSEGIVNSNSANKESTVSNAQTDDNGNDGVDRFDAPAGGDGGN